jgi:hypothetical protein
MVRSLAEWRGDFRFDLGFCWGLFGCRGFFLGWRGARGGSGTWGGDRRGGVRDLDGCEWRDSGGVGGDGRGGIDDGRDGSWKWLACGIEERERGDGTGIAAGEWRVDLEFAGCAWEACGLGVWIGDHDGGDPADFAGVIEFDFEVAAVGLGDLHGGAAGEELVGVGIAFGSGFEEGGVVHGCLDELAGAEGGFRGSGEVEVTTGRSERVEIA